MMQTIFSDQVRLLVSVLPHVAKESCFALKGGTAINLFIRDMPRLSVDIDLAYLPIQERNESLEAIDAAMRRIALHVESHIAGVEVTPLSLPQTDICIRLHVKRGTTMIKVEITPVLRGSINEAKVCTLSSRTEAAFGSAQMQLLSFNDLYGGKLCAALDRQHPRDLFDVHHLLNNEGISEELKNTFLVYLMSHNRPISELLDPKLKDIEATYEQEFKGMTHDPVGLDLLLDTRVEMIRALHDRINDHDREFLLSFKRGAANWDQFAYPNAMHLPAVRWKQHNLASMSAVKRKEALKKLKAVLAKDANV